MWSPPEIRDFFLSTPKYIIFLFFLPFFFLRNLHQFHVPVYLNLWFISYLFLPLKLQLWVACVWCILFATMHSFLKLQTLSTKIILLKVTHLGFFNSFLTLFHLFVAYTFSHPFCSLEHFPPLRPSLSCFFSLLF